MKNLGFVVFDSIIYLTVTLFLTWIIGKAVWDIRKGNEELHAPKTRLTSAVVAIFLLFHGAFVSFRLSGMTLVNMAVAFLPLSFSGSKDSYIRVSNVAALMLLLLALVLNIALAVDVDISLAVRTGVIAFSLGLIPLTHFVERACHYPHFSSFITFFICCGLFIGPGAGVACSIIVSLLLALLMLVITAEGEPRVRRMMKFASSSDVQTGRELDAVRELELCLDLDMDPENEVLPDNADDCYRDIFNRLRIHFENDRPYLNPNLTLRDVSRSIYTNKVYVSKAIGMYSGMNFRQFVNKYRVRHAMHLFLNNNEYKIADLSEMSGFHTGATFNSAFHLYLNMTPSEWCRKVRQSAGDLPQRERCPGMGECQE